MKDTEYEVNFDGNIIAFLWSGMALMIADIKRLAMQAKRPIAIRWDGVPWAFYGELPAYPGELRWKIVPWQFHRTGEPSEAYERIVSYITADLRSRMEVHFGANPYIIAPIDDPGIVEDFLPMDWCVGDTWWNGTGMRLADGRWKLPLMRPEDVGGAKNVVVEEMGPMRSASSIIVRTS
jgi:hypothetical protein